jgi:hypothetical protein
VNRGADQDRQPLGKRDDAETTAGASVAEPHVVDHGGPLGDEERSSCLSKAAQSVEEELKMEISFGDQVRFRDVPRTRALGLAGRVGQVFGQTTPSVSGVEVVGPADADYAICVALEDNVEPRWFSPQLLESVDHAPGTTASLGGKHFVRTAAGEWIEEETV